MGHISSGNTALTPLARPIASQIVRDCTQTWLYRVGLCMLNSIWTLIAGLAAGLACKGTAQASTISSHTHAHKR